MLNPSKNNSNRQQIKSNCSWPNTYRIAMTVSLSCFEAKIR